jgi:hypothetical protein
MIWHHVTLNFSGCRKGKLTLLLLCSERAWAVFLNLREEAGLERRTSKWVKKYKIW